MRNSINCRDKQARTMLLDEMLSVVVGLIIQVLPSQGIGISKCGLLSRIQYAVLCTV